MKNIYYFWVKITINAPNRYCKTRLDKTSICVCLFFRLPLFSCFLFILLNVARILKQQRCNHSTLLYSGAATPSPTKHTRYQSGKHKFSKINSRMSCCTVWKYSGEEDVDIQYV